MVGIRFEVAAHSMALLRGCHVPSPGVIVKLMPFSRLFYCKICPGFSEQWSAELLEDRIIPMAFQLQEAKKGEQTQKTQKRRPRRRTLEVYSADTSPNPLALPFASAGGVWSAVELRPTYAPNFQSNVRQSRLPSQNSNWRQKEPITNCYYACCPAFVSLWLHFTH